MLNTYTKTLRLLLTCLLVAVIAACSSGGGLKPSDGPKEKPVSKFEDLKEGGDQPVQIEQGAYKPVVPPLPGAQEEAAEHAAAFAAVLMLMKEEKWQEAIDALNEFTPKVTVLSGPFTNLGIAHLKLKQNEEAVAALEKATQINPQNPFAQNLYGLALRETGDFDGAKQAYLNAISLDSQYAVAHYNLAVMADLYLKDLNLAHKHYSQYQHIAGTPDETVARWLVDLERRGAKPTPIVPEQPTEPQVAEPASENATPQTEPAAAVDSDKPQVAGGPE